MNVSNVRLNSTNVNNNYRKQKAPAFTASTKDLMELAERSKDLRPWLSPVAKTFKKIEKEFCNTITNLNTFAFPLIEAGVLPENIASLPIKSVNDEIISNFGNFNLDMSKRVDPPFNATIKSQIIEGFRQMKVKDPEVIVLTKRS